MRVIHCTAVSYRGLVIGDWSLTVFFTAFNLVSKAPTFRSRSPTIFNAEILAVGVNGGAPGVVGAYPSERVMHKLCKLLDNYYKDYRN